MASSLSIIGAPSSAGAYAPGQEKAPAAFRRHGLLAALAAAGLQVNDRGDVPSFRWRPDPEQPQAMNVDAVAGTARAVAGHVAQALALGDTVLVLGGDCTVELGAVAGALADNASVGLVYVDLDVDLNIPATSDGALDWTGVAHLLDLPGAAAQLTSLGSRRPLLRASDVLFVAAGNISEPEAATIERMRLPVISLQEVRAGPQAATRRALEWGRGFDRMLVHVDADVLAYTEFPVAENVRRQDGLRLDELRQVLKQLAAAPNFSALTLTEVNPDHAPDEGETFAQLVRMLTDVLAETRS